MKQYKKYILVGAIVCFIAVALAAPAGKSEAFWPFGKTKKENSQNSRNSLGAVVETEKSFSKNKGYLQISVSKYLKSKNVPAGAKQFAFAEYILDATKSNEDVAVANLPLWYSVFNNGATTHLTNCVLYAGNNMLNGGAFSINPQLESKEMLFQFEQKFIVPSKTSKTITLRCDVSPQAIDGEGYSWGYNAQAASPMVIGVTSGEYIKAKEITSRGVIVKIAPSQSQITVLSPNGGEKWEIKKTHTIKWNYSGKIKKLSIYLENWEKNPSGGPLTWKIGESVSRVYDWTIPKDIQPKINTGDYYKIYVVDANDSSIYDRSENYFSIVEEVITQQPVIFNISPSSGPIGTKIQLVGDFTPSNNIVQFGPVAIPNLSSIFSEGAGADIMYFTIPKSGPSYCPVGRVCTQALVTIKPGIHSVSVKNANGESNIVKFIVEFKEEVVR